MLSIDSIKKPRKDVPSGAFVVVAFLVLQGYDVGGLGALGTFGYLKAHALTLGKSLEPLGLDSREVHENVGTVSLLDEAETLGITEPLYCSFCHLNNSLFCVCIPSHNAPGLRKRPRT